MQKKRWIESVMKDKKEGESTPSGVRLHMKKSFLDMVAFKLVLKERSCLYP